MPGWIVKAEEDFGKEEIHSEKKWCKKVFYSTPLPLNSNEVPSKPSALETKAEQENVNWGYNLLSWGITLIKL